MTKSFLAGTIVVIGIVIAGYFFVNQKETVTLAPSETMTASETPAATPTASPEAPIVPTPGPDIAQLSASIIVEGKGVGAKNGDSLSVLYKGTLTDGRVFDASELHGNIPFNLTLGAGEVITGWDKGLVGIKVGEKRRLFIPSELGYGTRGAPGTIIGPNADLIFDVELLKITPKK